MVIKVAIVGAPGRMGQLATRLVADHPDFALHAALGSSDELDAVVGADVVLDVTAPAASPVIVEASLVRGVPVLVGTSGWTAERLMSLEVRLRELPELGVVVIPNFSLGSAVATMLATIAAPHFDAIEIIETHHERKPDSPSGTAIRTAEEIGRARARAALGPVAAPHTDQRARGQRVGSVPVHSLRLPGISAEQEVIFGGTGETVRVIHRTLTDASYESGILLGLRAATERRGLTVGLDKLLNLTVG